LSLRSVRFFNENTGWISGNASTILKTTNGGLNWFTQLSYSYYDVYSLYVLNSNLVWAAANEGVLYFTTNGGTNWLTDIKTTNNPLFSVFFINENTGWVAGGNGTILKTTNSGYVFVNNISKDIPQSFYLHQNYPNPFNPTTTIRYELPRAGVVRLAVYDVMGREVEMLVNERLTAGSYEAVWDACLTNGQGTRFASGVYFYRLTAEGYGETKRMLLIK
jgi:hypothetical protein